MFRDEIANSIGDVNKKGVRLWVEKGELHYKAPRGALTKEEIAHLRACKDEIVALLTETSLENDAEFKSASDSPVRRAPLSFSQLARWHSLQRENRPFTRSLASAMRLRG